MIVPDSGTFAETRARIEREDRALQAWAFLAPSAAAAVPSGGELTGMPFGVKDIIDVAGMPTAFGMHGPHDAALLDAACVALLRAAGAVPIGKTRTTAHAWRDPAPTFNPLDPARTPGGSSAGSAAAVAAGHVPFALGTQTIGSVLRPAAYCGVVGFKPTWGRIPMQGVAPVSPALDHVGLIAADLAITTRVARALLPDLTIERVIEPRLAVAEAVNDPRFDAETRAAVDMAIETLRASGFVVERVQFPAFVDAIPLLANLIAAYEAYATLAPLLALTLPPELRGLLAVGAQTTRADYHEALARRESARALVDRMLGSYDAAIVPCGDAAPSRESTGDGSPFALASALGLPALSIPIPGTAPAAVSLQLVARRGLDARLLALGSLVEASLA